MYRRFISTVLAAVLAPIFATALAGCSAVETRFAAPAGAHEGIAYNLPRARFTLTLVEAGGAISISLAGPQMLPDENALLVARLPHNGTSDDNVTITVDTHSNLLLKVDATSTGRVTDIANNAARSFAFLQGAETAQGTTIFQADFDPEEYQAVVDAANEALRGYYARYCTTGLTAETLPLRDALRDAGYADSDRNAVLRERLLRCRGLQEAGLGVAGGPPLISLRLGAQSALALAAARAGPPPDYSGCTRGICYRPLRPVQFTLGVGRYYALTDTFLMPDASRLVFVALNSGLFAQQHYVLNFTDGVLTSYQQDAHSELVGLARLPADIVGTLIAAPGEALGLRQNRLTAENDYLAQVRANAEAQTQTAATCRANPNACPGTAYRVIRIPITPRGAAAANAIRSTEQPSQPPPAAQPVQAPKPQPADGVPDEGG